jgi:low affinity Fe/Cu permease
MGETAELFMDLFFTQVATFVARLAGKPGTFIFAVALIILWGTTGPIFGFSDTWQLVVNTSTTIVTFLIVFLIQNSQNRDAAAIQAKLDELIRATEAARNQFIGIEHLADHEIEAIRDWLETETGERGAKASAVLERLQKRL